jgi:3-deoxy-D-manno-octulosonic-acid transferase
VAAGLALYRAVTGAAGLLLGPPLRAFAPRNGALRAALREPRADVLAARGSTWIHAASMGEMVAARRWAETLAGAGARTPFYVTARTAAGLARARAELDTLGAAGIAPLDFPGVVRATIRAVAPRRLDIVETEIWPNLLVEAARARVPVLFVSATVSAATASRLARLGVAGRGLFGGGDGGIRVLAQSTGAAGRFAALGVPGERITVVGDLKAEPPFAGFLPPPSARPLVAFGSMRPGEEEPVVTAAHALAGTGLRLLVAPRHPEGVVSVEARLAREGFRVSKRDDAAARRETLDAWLAGLASTGAAAVGILATRGELGAAYGAAAAAIVGGTFAAYGGHNALEPAARRCPVIVGPHHEDIQAAVESLTGCGAARLVRSGGELAAALQAWARDPAARDAAGASAARVAAEAARSAERALAALRAFGLEP